MNHLREWSQSCVDHQLIDLNVIPLQGDRPLEYLFYADELPRRNDGRVTNPYLKLYAHTESGGWWCSGIDLLTGGDDLWGCFKPVQPRCSVDQGKIIKYEHPPKATAGLFALRVPLHLWQQIANRYEIELLSTDIAENQPDLGFWQWLINHPSIPLCITEGAKKAGALLTAGYAAIALPGVNGGYRTPKDAEGNRLGKSRLIPQLEKLAKNQRTIYLVFDQDSKPNTIKAVNAAIRKTGYLLTQIGSEVKIINWNPELGKGVDDFIANKGKTAFNQAYQQAISLDLWRASCLNSLSYTPNLQINSRYLGEIAIPDEAKIIGIKSPKGTGKTKFLESIVAQAIAQNKQVLVIGHRVRLVEHICQRFGLKYITEIKDNQQQKNIGYGLCIDSLHPNSQAQFDSFDYSNSLIIFDEIEQIIWHGLNSNTCQDNRVTILKSLKSLMQNVIEGKGKICVTDADLTDVSLDYLISLADVSIQPYIIENTWKPNKNESWQVYNYVDSTPKKIVRDLENHIREGGKPFVCLSAQKLKSRWGTCTLETYFQQQFPDLKILRIDSESLADPTHPAYGCITKLNEILPNYDLVLASPSIETGISIDLKGHFTSVWCIAQGLQSDHSVCQILARIRENIPRYIWIAKYGFNRIGNGTTSLSSLLTAGHRLTQANIRLLQQADFASIDDLDTGFQAESLLCWGKMAVRVNAAMLNYREAVISALLREGHQIYDPVKQKSTAPANSQSSNSLILAITAVRDQNYQEECEAIATAKELREGEYQQLKKKLLKNSQLRHSLRKYDLSKRYGIPVTPQLVARDDQGWYHKLRLHYFLTVGRPYVMARDAAIAQRFIQQGEGSLFIPDFNRSQLGAVIGTMEILGIPVLLSYPQRELRNTDQDLQEMGAIALNNRIEIKTIMGVGLAKNSTPIMLIKRFLDQIGYALNCIRYERIDQKRMRVYQLIQPQDGRENVFAYWLTMDGISAGISDLDHDLAYKRITLATDKNQDYVQLCLKF